MFDRYSVQSASTAVLFTGVHVYLTGILCSLQHLCPVHRCACIFDRYSVKTIDVCLDGSGTHTGI